MEVFDFGMTELKSAVADLQIGNLFHLRIYLWLAANLHANLQGAPQVYDLLDHVARTSVLFYMHLLVQTNK